jgi:hypothetical protein
MMPTLRPGRIICAWSHPAHIAPGDVVVLHHDGIEMIKRVQAIDSTGVFVIGDHPMFSTDSREFGWLNRSVVVAKVWWPRV